MAKPLTTRQHAVLDTIRNWVRQHGYPPTIRELGKHLGIKSLRGVTTHLDAIAKKGFLKREPRARSISLLDLVAPFEQALRIPVVGRLQAGQQPSLMPEQVEGHVVIDGAWVGVSSSDAAPQHFALKARGDGMIAAGILDGDHVVVRQQATAEPGEIVVVLVGEEALIRRWWKDGERIRLEPAHPTMPPIVLEPQQPLTMVGTVVAVFRKVR